MNIRCVSVSIAIAFLSCCGSAHAQAELGSRPLYLVDSMDEGRLKDKLQSCAAGPFESSKFSIGHRGAPLQYPEHTKESYIAAAEQGAGIIECDVTFTKDRELVCRHSQCDLHTTTNILTIPELAEKCSIPFVPATINNSTGKVITPAAAKCCTSDITVDEFLSLKGKKDAFNASAKTIDEYLTTANNVQTEQSIEQGTLLTHAQSIELFKSLNVGMTPELKAADVKMPYEGDYTQEMYAQQLVNEYEAAEVSAKEVWMQSFNLKDVLYWVENTPPWGEQAVFLDGRYSSRRFNPSKERSWKPSMAALKSQGVNIIAPPLWVLLQGSDQGDIVPSLYAKKAKEQGMDIITWTLERSGVLNDGGGWYYQSVNEAINNDGDVYTVLNVLAKDVGVVGVFSDWPATVTYYANCMANLR